MKHNIFVAVIVGGFICNLSNAQLIRSYGIKFGIAQASQTWDYSRASIAYGLKIYDKPRLGLNVGGYIEWFNLPVVSIVTEMQYIQKGAKDEFEVRTIENPDGTGEMKSVTPRVDYLSVPILAKLSFETPITKFYVIAGPRIDFFTGYNKEASGAVFSEFRSTEFGVSGGVGLSFSLVELYKVGAEIRYSYCPQYAYNTQYLTVRNSSTEFLLVFGF